MQLILFFILKATVFIQNGHLVIINIQLLYIARYLWDFFVDCHLELNLATKDSWHQIQNLHSRLSGSEATDPLYLVKIIGPYTCTSARPHCPSTSGHLPWLCACRIKYKFGELFNVPSLYMDTHRNNTLLLSLCRN